MLTALRDSLDPDGAAYRRGTVFGLTIAEVFVLLLFLLMLLFQSLNQEWEIDAEEDKEAKGNLVEVTADRDKLRLDRDKLKQYQEELRKRIRTLGLERNSTEQQLRKVEQELSDARRLLDGRESELAKEVQEERDRAERAESELGELETLLEKGVNPPCWYHKVPDPKKASGEREKPYYSFNVGVFDDHLIVRQLPPPPGGAEDDGDLSFADEAKKLEFDALPYGQRLSGDEFKRHFKPISEAGKNKQVRSYSCVFWIRVWDQTAPGAKSRWKNAHYNDLQPVFQTFQPQDEPWASAAPSR